MKRITLAAVSVAALFLLTAGAQSASADTFYLTSCHISGSTCEGGSVTQANAFGTVVLSQVGTGVLFDVVLLNGNRFVETGAGGGALFVFNDASSGSTVTNISATLNGSTITIAGGLSGLTNQAAFNADGTGNFTAKVFCTVDADCNGGSAPNMNDLHFTVTNRTLAQLETTNASGNFFVADILCGANQAQCVGKTGPVDVSTPGTVPDGGMTLMLLGSALVGLEALRRRVRA